MSVCDCDYPFDRDFWLVAAVLVGLALSSLVTTAGRVGRRNPALVYLAAYLGGLASRITRGE